MLVSMSCLFYGAFCFFTKLVIQICSGEEEVAIGLQNGLARVRLPTYTGTWLHFMSTFPTLCLKNFKN
jgi:hypothetical protein